jgi:hypothetical protein
MKDFIITLGMIAGITACAGVWQLWKECARLARHIDQLREDVGVWRRIDHEAQEAERITEHLAQERQARSRPPA